MIVYEGNVTGRSEGDYTISQGFNGVSWYHYFAQQGSGFFTVAGIGFYVLDIEDGPDIDPGAGYLIGGGYEFTSHVQATLYISGGQTSYEGIDLGHNHISLLVSAVAF